MRKVLLSSAVALLSISNLNAADPSLYPSSISMLMGYNIASQESRLDNSHSFSFRFTQNDFGIDNFGIGAFQLALDYTPDIKYKDSSQKTTSVKFGSNVLWYLDNISEMTPYILVGAGIEHLSNPTGGFNSLDFYANGGAGVEYQIRSDIALIGEAKYSYSDEKRKGATMSAGLKFSFGDY